MEGIVEQLKKERLPVDGKCYGKGLSEKEEALRVGNIQQCSRIEPVEQADDQEAARCTSYVDPGYWWKRGICPLADHVKDEVKPEGGKIRAGQQKQKKVR